MEYRLLLIGHGKGYWEDTLKGLRGELQEGEVLAIVYKEVDSGVRTTRIIQIDWNARAAINNTALHYNRDLHWYAITPSSADLEPYIPCVPIGIVWHDFVKDLPDGEFPS